MTHTTTGRDPETLCTRQRLIRRVRLCFAHLCGQLAGRLLVRAAKTFLRAGDMHEYEHCHAAITVGGCEPGRCRGPLLYVLTDTLEAIAHFAPGEAGVHATQALIDAGVWGASVEREPREHPLEHWLQFGCAYVPVHDQPERRNDRRRPGARQP